MGTSSVTPPVVGICAAVERVSWGVWDGYEVALAPRNYVRALQRAGAIALILPPDQVAVDDPDVLLDRVDALLLAGGPTSTRRATARSPTRRRRAPGPSATPSSWR